MQAQKCEDPGRRISIEVGAAHGSPKRARNAKQPKPIVTESEKHILVTNQRWESASCDETSVPNPVSGPISLAMRWSPHCTTLLLKENKLFILWSPAPTDLALRIFPGSSFDS